MIWYTIKVVVVYIVVFVPSPLQPLQSLSRLSHGSCSREGSSIVRHFIQTVWRPIFKKFEVKMPDQCPLHFSRDVFSAQELAKLHYRVNLWTCGLCGKSFYREPYLDMHMANKHSDSLLKENSAVCYADYCDVFRCSGYLKILRQTRKKKANFRGSFTKIFGSREALYDLGINVHDEEEFNFFQEKTRENTMEEKKSASKNAVMTMPPLNVLRALDSANHNDGNRFRVGVDNEQNLQDPLEFNIDPIHEHDEKNRRGSRPREAQGRKNSVNNENIEPKKHIFLKELEDIATKIVKLLEKSVVGQKLKLLNINGINSAKETDANDENLDEDIVEEDYCEPVSMQETQDRCMKLIQDCISPLLIELADSEYVEMEGLLNRQLCEFLTCERYQEFAGIPNSNSETQVRKGLEVYLLMAVLTFGLAIVLIVIYFAMSLCFWQLQSQSAQPLSQDFPIIKKQNDMPTYKKYPY